ncbi:MAG: hypothetical protein RhofKO_07010 [Rhodothermales bacterium]
MTHDTKSRRHFLRQLGALTVVGTTTTVALSACGGGDGGAAALTCTDTTGLAEADINMRQSVQYVDETPDPAKPCSACALYTAAAEGQCGGCTVVKGPIHPDGWCTLWAPKQG